jgi:N-acylglucosamine 2-epimerase
MAHISHEHDFLQQSLQLYRDTLLHDVAPFWLRYGWDKQHGGIGNILDDAGNVVGTDKYLWSQGRALWTFSALYRRIERRREWIDFAEHIFNYLITHGRDEQGRWVFRLDKDGKPLDGPISIYVDGFVMAGLTEFYSVTGNTRAKELALETYENTRARIAQPGGYEVAPYVLEPGTKTHGVAMVFALFYYELGQALARTDIERDALSHAYQVLNDFYRPERDAIVEFVTLDGQFIDSPEGRACVPGHAIESLWFLISIFERSGDSASIQKCCRLIKRHLELGWDEEFGGLMLARDIDGKEPIYWKHPTHKPWWVQVEALVATAFAYVHTREPWCLEWHRKVQEFAFAHYPVPTGEWTQWVDRQGKRMGNLALPVKDPFHLPRALIYLINILQREVAAGDA